MLRAVVPATTIRNSDVVARLLYLCFVNFFTYFTGDDDDDDDDDTT
jgi:hypothetical protein